MTSIAADHATAKLPRLRTFFVFGFLAVVAYLHREALAEWYGRTTEDRYSHAPLVAAVAAYLFWMSRPEKVTSDRWAWGGVCMTLVAGLGLVVGELSALWTVVQYSLFIAISGVAWARYGASLKAMWFWLLLLVTVIPLPYMVDVTLSGKMQLLSSSLGVDMLRAIGVPVYQDGNIIDLGSYKLQVAEACSGLNYLFPLFSIGLLVGSLLRGSLLLRAAVVLSTIPLTIVMNSARIAVVGVLVNWQGRQAAEGFTHYFEGWVVFLLCLAVLAAEVSLINRVLRPASRLSLRSFTLAHGFRQKTEYIGGYFSRPFVAAVFIVLAMSLATERVATREEIVPARTSLTEFPISVQGWEGVRVPFKNNEDAILGLTDYHQADYRKDGAPVNLYIGYVNSQRKGFVPHSPQACIPGGGWEITEATSHTFPTGQGPLAVTKLTIAKGEYREIVYYWFRQRGKDMQGEYSMKLHLLIDSIRMHRTDGALVRIVVPWSGSAAATDAIAENFVQAIYKELPRFIPD